MSNTIGHALNLVVEETLVVAGNAQFNNAAGFTDINVGGNSVVVGHATFANTVTGNSLANFPTINTGVLTVTGNTLALGNSSIDTMTQVLTAVPVATGSGYANGNTLSIPGGTKSVNAILTVVTGLANTSIVSLVVTNGGVFSVNPGAGALATANTTGTGVGATVTVTMGGLISGFSRLPNGLILQWGTAVANDVAGNVNLMLPVTTLLAVTLSSNNAVALNGFVGLIGSNTSVLAFRSSVAINNAISWIALGI